MADDDLPPPIRLMNFVSEDQLKEARKSRGARVEDGTAQRDRSLYEILKENKDKKDAEFNERFKHRPPKALDEDETEFLDQLEMSKKEFERHLADEEEQQLRSFQAAVASQSNVIQELKEAPSVQKNQVVEQDKNSLAGRKNPPSRHPSAMVIKVKKAKVESPESQETARVEKSSVGGKMDEQGRSGDLDKGNVELPSRPVVSGLVAYSDESEDDE
ncbi:uncharacterized protein LOC127260365 [Andrographis paniculata]|uniref:uncharacterized protein LOC127260365 n=1 Tax=Andrographis paniculata TaxID=175694 RepID=UPI0021E8D926|nr:uncharacterized protein LOC127260365 [Andrographis paniculata]